MTRLMVLGLLRKKPMSGYEIQQFLQLGHVDKWAGILPGSIYHALKKLESEGCVAVEAVEHTGNRSKATYKITAQGEREYLRLVLESLATPSLAFPTNIYTGLLFHADLPREQVLAAIQTQMDHLSREYQEKKAGQFQKNPDIPLEAHLVFENMFDLYESHLKFLRKIKEWLSQP